MRGLHSDRPIQRRLIKLGFSAFAGRKRAHWQDTFPGLRIDRERGQILYFGESAGVLSPTRLPDHAKEIAIVGSGPSIRKQHLTRLPPRSALLLNGAISLAAQLHPMAILIEDERFVWRHFDMLRDTPADCPWFLSPGVIRALLERDRTFLIGKQVRLIEDLLKPVHSPRLNRADPALAGVLDRQKLFSLEPERGIMPAGTVAYTAMQFAMASGPCLIGLAGVDLSNANQPRFYETMGNAAPSGIVRGLSRIIDGFSAAREIAGSRGIKLRCYSPVSVLLDVGYPHDPRLE